MESSSSAWASPEEFEFTTCAAAGVDVKGADDLFYKGQLLPLALPPRLQMVHSLSVREEECEEAAAVAALAGAGAAPWLHMACSSAQATGDEAMAKTRQQRGWRSSGPPTLSLRGTVPPPSQQQQVKGSSGFRRAQDSVGSRHFWGDSSAQPSSDCSADSSSDARDSSGSSKDSLDLSAPEKGDSLATSSSNSQCGYSAGQRARHDKFFHALVAFGGKTGAPSELAGGHGDGRHARVFSWLKPASSRWNGIFGSSKKAGHAAKKMAAMEEDGDGRGRSSASSGRPASPPRDSSSSDDLPTAPSRYRHSGPLASCDDEFLVNCRDRLSGPLSFRGSAMRDPAKCDWEGVRASHDLAEERREWQSMHSSFRESAADPFLSDSISAVDGHHSGREHWRMNPSFNYEDACHEEQQQQQQVPGLTDASRSSDKAAKRRNWGTLVTDSGGRHRYLDKLFRSFHVRIPLKSSESLPKTKSTRRNQTTSANVPMMLNPICSTSTEKQSAIQGAIAYCKRSQSTHISCKPKGVAASAGKLF